MIIEYKFNQITWDTDSTDITITLCKGEFRDVTIINGLTMQTETINMFVRTERLANRSLTRSGTYTFQQIQKYVNNRLKEIRDESYPNLTFLAEQEIYV